MHRNPTQDIFYQQIQQITVNTVTNSTMNIIWHGQRMRAIRRVVDNRTFLFIWALVATLLLILRPFSVYSDSSNCNNIIDPSRGYVRVGNDIFDIVDITEDATSSHGATSTSTSSSAVTTSEQAPACPYVWHGGSPTHNGSCWCGSDDYCMCTPSLAIDCIIEVRPKTVGSHRGGASINSSSHSRVPPTSVVLVYRSQPPSEQYAIVGGFVNVGEEVEAAVVREVKEETNLDVTELRLLGVYSDPKRDARRHTASVVYIGSVESTASLRSGDDAKSAVVVPIDRVLSLRLAFDHADILRDYLQLLSRRHRGLNLS